MAVVVSNTTPIHYLILVGQIEILEKLYANIIIPPAVFAELRHPSAPAPVSNWASRPPAWLTVLPPASTLGVRSGIGLGEREAILLAGEIRADWVLLDDKAARRVAAKQSLKVKGTMGVVADAARAKLLNFVETIEQLQRTSMHLDQVTVDRIVREYEQLQGGRVN